MRYANIYICFFVLHLGFFQQPRPRVGICLARLDALTSKYNTFSYCQVGVSNPNLTMPTRGRVAPRWGRDATSSDENASSSGEDAPLKKINAQKKPLSTNLLKEACKKVGSDLLSRGCAVPSARLGLTSLFGMGRGDPQRYNHQNIGWTTLELKF